MAHQPGVQRRSLMPKAAGDDEGVDRLVAVLNPRLRAQFEAGVQWMTRPPGLTRRTWNGGSAPTRFATSRQVVTHEMSTNSAPS